MGSESVFQNHAEATSEVNVLLLQFLLLLWSNCQSFKENVLKAPGAKPYREP